ncbi:hypothetical protein [Streptomyces sp. NPDC047014]|uniref:hypothetical protein n=1 Tax=Streptomyces sp. NPDC047014 TaxID=3155736 RepID=UPI0033CA9199
MMFRWVQPCACSTRSAVSTSDATSAARYGLSGASAISAASGLAGTSSLTIHSESPSANTSKTWSSRGWSGMEAAACAASIARRTAGRSADPRPRPPPGAPGAAGTARLPSTSSASTTSGNGTCRTSTSCPLRVSNARVSTSSYSSDGGNGRR